MERHKLPGTPALMPGQLREQRPKKVILYASSAAGDLDDAVAALLRFTNYVGLEPTAQFTEEGKTGEAFQAAYRELAKDTSHECGLLVPHLGVLGTNRRSVRGRMAALRELGVTIYEAESGAVINWVHAVPESIDDDRNT